MRCVQILTILTCLTASLPAHGKDERVVSTSDGQCRPFGSADFGREDPVIFGDEFDVPGLNIRFVRKNTGEPLIPDEITLFYMWNWLGEPYEDAVWGRWNSAIERVKCTTNGQSSITIPPYTVRPRGWYDGRYTRFPFTLLGSQRPRFDHIEISIQFGDCRRRWLIGADDLEPYEGNIAIFNLACGGPRPDVEFQPYD